MIEYWIFYAGIFAGFDAAMLGLILGQCFTKKEEEGGGR